MIFSNLKGTDVLCIHRCYFQNIQTRVIELHFFSDASGSEDGASVYTPYENEEGVNC